MRKVFIGSIITALAIEIAGAAANLISFYVSGEFIFAHMITGGEWMGWSGFGMLLNRTYPMSSPEHPVSGSTWISFHPGSLIRTLVLSFAAAFVILLIIHLVRKKFASKASKA